MRLDGAVALVTGASGGLGGALAHELAGHGARVLAHGRDADRTTRVADAVGGRPLVADLAAPQQRARLAEQAEAAYGRVDVLVGNAGVGWSGPFSTMDLDTLRRVVEVDLLAQVELTRLLLPGMVERRAGHVCLVGSVAGRTAVAGEAAYAAAKAGLDIFAESLRAEALGSGVQVSLVCPGAVRTGFFEARGRPYGRRLPRPVDPVTVARRAVGGIESGRAETWVPRWLRLAPVVRALSPTAYRRLAGRLGEPVRLAVPPPGEEATR